MLTSLSVVCSLGRGAADGDPGQRVVLDAVSTAAARRRRLSLPTELTHYARNVLAKVDRVQE